MRLLQVATIAGTVEAFLLPFARHFRALGWEVDCAAAGAPCSDAIRESHNAAIGVRWSRNGAGCFRLPQSAAAIRRAVFRRRYDIVHVHTPIASFVTRLALRSVSPAYRGRVVYTAHGFHFHPMGRPAGNAIWAACEKLCGCVTDALVVINEADRAAAAAMRIVPEDRIVHMPGIGIDLAAYDSLNVPEGRVVRFREELGLRPADVLFLMIGELNPGKRHADVIRALSLLKRRDVHVAFAGVGPGAGAVRALVERSGLNGNVHLLGFRTDIPVCLKASRATLLVSEREGLPRACLESLAAGVPVIGSKVRGVVDAVNGSCGIIVELGDCTAIASAMGHLADAPHIAARLGQAGRLYVQKFSLDRVLRLHEDLYARTLQQSPRCW